MNHQVSVSGASEKVNYLFSLGFYTQDGIVGGNFDRSNYERLTLRSNTQYTLFDESKERNWLNSLKVTSNLSYARIKSTNFDDNSTWGTPLGSALALSPILNVYDETEEAIKAQFDKYGTTAEYTPVYDPRNGNFSASRANSVKCPTRLPNFLCRATNTGVINSSLTSLQNCNYGTT